MTRLTIVIPAYNNADFIGDTMRSILSQDFTDYRLVVADHASSDGTLAVLEEFTSDPRVSITHTPAGGGAVRNWRSVTDAATTELVKLVCGDDLLYPGALTAQVAAFDEHPEAVIVAGRRDILDASGVPFVRARGLDGLFGFVEGRRALRASVRAGTNLLGEPACVMFRTEALRAAGGWDESHAFLLDQASYARVLLRGPMVGLRAALAGFRVNAGQWSVSLAKDQAKQASAFHDELADRGVISRWDARVGNFRAWVTALMRRSVYIVFARRLRVAE